MVPRNALQPPPASWTARQRNGERDDSTHSKRSHQHSTQSNEADDERSSFSFRSDMGPNAGRGGPQYEGEDTRLTSKKELSGFYMYGWAAEVFVVCGMGSFIPITLEQLARERGVLQNDHSRPCSASFQVPEPPFNTSQSYMPTAKDAEQCVVYVLGAEINTASFAMYTFSISVLIQTLLILSMSAAADHGRYRKTLLVIFAFIGSITTMLFLPVVPKVFLLGALFAIIANTCFGASFVLLNSFLPLLVRYHPDIQYPSPASSGEPQLIEGDEESSADPTTALLPSSDADGTPTSNSRRATISQELRLSTKISANGIGIGYIAAIIVQVLAIVIVLALKSSSTFSLRLVLFVIGAWWFAFTIPAAFWLRPRPGPPLKFAGDEGKTRTCMAYLSYSWKSLGKTIMHARSLKDVLLFLGAWFMISDSIATVSGTAILFAKTSLRMEPAALALINVIATTSGVVGAFTWSRVSVIMGLKPSQTILACICLFEIIPIYGLLGYIPAVQRWGVLGLQQQWEMYPLGAVYGFVLGGLSSYCRSLYGELIPEGFEAAFYALYAITDKGSSIFGPAIVGAITDATGEIRPAFWFLAVLVGLPFPLMWFVNVERGKREGGKLARELSKMSKPRQGYARELL
ncbi:autophagy protein Atg22 [Rhizodiscina lignyota]|uniref:Autophagy-related protein n=1 Tax=Rhizodiscina lignyota TaxID=1504668 RepID=A0A9P4M337_9PEZI|nr:autophagy protein Atg22 [Rhizodiscina lignyota]